MTIRIPDETKQFKQIGNSDVFGNVWSSFNLDLTENLGRIRVGPRCHLVDGSAINVANMETPVAFEFYDDGTNERIWCIAGARMFYNSGDPDDTFTQDATASTPTNLDSGCDMKPFNGALYVAGNGDLLKYNSSWATVSTAPNGGNCSMCVYANRLYATQSTSQIFSCDTSDVIVEPTSAPNTNLYTLQLSDYMEGGADANRITSIRAASDRIWIATVNVSANSSQTHASGARGRVFEWDGVSAQATKAYELDSMGAAALVIKDDIPYIVDAEGRLRKFDGSAFKEVARLPVNPAQYLRTLSNSNPVQRFIHHRGIGVQDGRIVMFINNINNDGSTYNENLHSGIWEYDENIGLYHKSSASYLRPATASSSRTDFAQAALAEVGAMYVSKSTNSSDNDGSIMFGAKYYTDATSTAYGVFCVNSNDTKSKVGYLVTTKIDSANIEDAWEKIYVKHKRFLDSTDRVIIKYRTTEVAPVVGTITWTSTTTFTSTVDLSSYAEGDEVEILKGTGGGQIENISSIVNNAGTYTVTLPTVVTGATGTATARFQKWITVGEYTDQVLDVHEASTNAASTWIQLKIVMYFTGKDELNEIIIRNSSHKDI